MKLCDYGCGKEAKYIVTKSGKLCCEDHRNKCPNMKLKNSKSQLRNPFRWSDKDKEKMSENRKGENNSMFGKTHTEKTLKKMRDVKKGRNYIEKYGEERAKEIIKTQTKSRKEVWDDPTSYLNSKQYRLNLKKSMVPRKLTLNKIKDLYPHLYKIEELKEENGSLYARCKYHKCKNSKENNGWFKVTRYQLQLRRYGIESHGGHYLYCSKKCKQECPLYGLNPSHIINRDKLSNEIYYTQEEYNIWREEVLKRANYKCEYCGEKAEHCHHIIPQKINGYFSLDPDFGLACCEKCHYKYGHKDECSTGKLANLICENK